MRVAHVEHESRNIISLVLKPSTSNRLRWRSSQGNMSYFASRSQPTTPPLLRSYSLWDWPSLDRFLSRSTSAESDGAASIYVHARCTPANLDVTAPRGSFIYQVGDKPVVLLERRYWERRPCWQCCTVWPMKRHRRARGKFGGCMGRTQRRRGPSVLRRRCVTPVGAIATVSHSHIRYSQPGSQDRFSGDGIMTPLAISVCPSWKNSVKSTADISTYPPPTAFLLHDLSTGLNDSGCIAKNRIPHGCLDQSQRITPGVVDVPRRSPHAPISPHPTGPAVGFARSGLTVPWDPTYKSVLELAEACDVPVKWSCRTGVCHTCETGLVAGAVNYDPEPLEPPADGNVLICCSHPISEILLDL